MNALLGGILIGTAASLMLFWNGRVTGISGITYSLFRRKNFFSWPIFFVLGLICGGAILSLSPIPAFGESTASPLRIAVAGLLVGFGTVFGSGCTSGHGVCGISRLSRRSIVATLCFIAAGALTVFVLRWWGLE